MQRFGIIGDVHAQRRTLQVALEFLRTRDVDGVLCTGDIVDGPTQSPDDTQTCIDLLQEHGVLVVRGNHDRWILADQMRELPGAASLQNLTEDALAFLRGLPSTRDIETNAGKLLLCHGMGANDMQGVWPSDDAYSLRWKTELHELIDNPEYSFVLAGHTHARMLRRMLRREGVLTLINAGTLHPEFSPGCAIADFQNAQLQFFDIIGDEVRETKAWEL